MKRGTSSRHKMLSNVAQVVLWIAVFSYQLFLQSEKQDVVFMLPKYIITTSLLICLFYYNSSVLIPRFLARRKISAYILLIAAGIIVVTFVNVVSQYIIYSANHFPEWKLKHQLYDMIFLSLIVWGISTAFRITAEWFTNEIMRKDAEQKQVSAELAFLKSQINPHFLFNSLNNIYALCHRNDDPAAADAIAKLSGLMRYMLYGSATSTVKLSEEIEYLNNYLDLQKMRINKNIDVKFDVTGDTTEFNIAPLLLIPFVENAFKYGLSYVSDSFIHIECSASKNEMRFSVRNTVHERGKSELSSGIGLENVKRRLELLYGGKHALRIDESNSVFDVKMILPSLNEK